MRIEEFSRALEKAALAGGFTYKLSGSAPEDAIAEFEARSGSAMPSEVAMFYRHHNGLSIAVPAVEIFPVQELSVGPSGMVPFCRLDGVNELSFDVRQRNAADQWTIVSAEAEFQVTMTMASFLTNKLFAWLKRGRPIWRKELYPDTVDHNGTAPPLVGQDGTTANATTLRIANLESTSKTLVLQPQGQTHELAAKQGLEILIRGKTTLPLEVVMEDQRVVVYTYDDPSTEVISVTPYAPRTLAR